MATRPRVRLLTGQLQVDHQIVLQVREAGTRDSHICRLVTEALYEKAVGTMKRLDEIGTLLRTVADRGNSLHLPVPRSYPNHALSIIHSTASTACNRFVEIDIIAGRWCAHDGITIDDSLMTSCFCTFTQEYNEFWYEEQAGGSRSSQTAN